MTRFTDFLCLRASVRTVLAYSESIFQTHPKGRQRVSSEAHSFASSRSDNHHWSSSADRTGLFSFSSHQEHQFSPISQELPCKAQNCRHSTHLRTKVWCHCFTKANIPFGLDLTVGSQRSSAHQLHPHRGRPHRSDLFTIFSSPAVLTSPV